MKRPEPTRWHRRKYWLNALLLLAPIWFLYASLTPVFPPPWETKTAGQITVTPSPHDEGAPYEHDGIRVKDFSFRLCEGCAEAIRLASANVGLAPTSPAEVEDGIVHGRGNLQEAHVPYPARLSGNERLWLSVQTWDGALHHIDWPLR